MLKAQKMMGRKKRAENEADDDDMIYMLPLMMLRRCGLCRECKHLIEN